MRKIFLLILICCFSGCVTPQGHREWKTFSAVSEKYQIEYPADWEARVAYPPTGPGPFYEPDILLDDEAQKVTFLEKEFGLWQGEFQVKVLTNPKGLSLEQWADEIEVDDVMDESESELDGHRALRFSVFGYDHTIIEILSVFEGRLYYISFSGANPNDPDIGKHQQIYKRMLSSFRFPR